MSFNLDFLLDFCGNVPIWNDSLINRDDPVFTTCFQDTALVWVPCAFLWIASPFWLIYVWNTKRYVPLPFSALNISKAVVVILMICMTILQLLFQEQDGFYCQKDVALPPSYYTAVGVKFVTFIYAIVLQQIQRHKGIKTSGMPFAFWMFMIFAEIVPFYSRIVSKIDCKEYAVYYIYVGFVVLEFLLHCFAEHHVTSGYQEIEDQNEKPCPEEDASVLNRVTFTWLTSLVTMAFRKKIQVGDLWQQTPKLQSDTLAPYFEQYWQEEVVQAERRQQQHHRKVFLQNGYIPNGRNSNWSNGYVRKTEETPLLESGRYNMTNGYTADGADDKEEEPKIRPNLYLAIWKAFRLYWAEAVLFSIIGECTWLLQPVILGFIIDIIENKSSTSIPDWQGYAYAIMLFFTLSINSFFFHILFHHMMTLGLKIKTALICTIYKKALTMKRIGAVSTTVGEIVNLMSVDCQRIQDGILWSFYIILIPILVTLACVQVWGFLGIASIGGLAVIVAAMALNAYIATIQHRLQTEILYLKGSRIRLLNEIIGGIKVLKMYAWEPSFISKVNAIRKQELDRLWKFATVTAVTVMLAVHSPFLMNFVLVTVYVVTDASHYLSAEQAFVTLAIVNIMRYPIALMPFMVNGGIQAVVSIKRIQKFLNTDDLDRNTVDFVKKAEYAIRVEHADFSWDRSNPVPTLTGIDMKIRDGQLIAVVGQVGTGKSSLIQAILGELEKLRGSVTLKGSVAYVPQEAWIQNMTLRDNILFGRSYNERKYKKVLDACALLPDLEILAGGDMTEIGEKGINISGGQKQRVSLARAVYNNADVYLMDDPLSAVDSHVGKHLFRKVIGNEGLLRNKTRILVTHGVHWLPMVDTIVVLKDGKISEMGSYEELLAYKGAFAEFLHMYLLQDVDGEEEDPEIEKLKDQIFEQMETAVSDGGVTSDDNSVNLGNRRRRRVSSRHTSIGTYSRSVSKAKVVDKKEPVDINLSKLIAEETTEEGNVKIGVLKDYAKAMGFLATFFVFLFICIFQGLNVYSNFWLTYWTEDPYLKNTSLSDTDKYEETYVYYLVVYCVLGVVQGVFLYLCFYLALTRMVQASGKLHGRMLTSILRSPMAFFDTTPIGRMMNRFSSDIDIMDNKLPESFRLWTIMLFATAAVLIVVSITTPIFIAAIVPVTILYIFLIKYYLPTARQMRRIESVNRSPIFNHFSETITGASVIRAYRCSDRFVEESRKRVDRNIKFYFAANTGSRWIGIRLEMMGNVIALAATLFALISPSLSGADVGLSISYAVQITITLNLVVLAVSELEMNVVSAERVQEYTSLPPEAEWIDYQSRPPTVWPKTGTVEYKSYTTRYRPGLDLVLRGISCKINNGEKVGIVGRTGAGKSSLTLSLFRLIEAAGGAILIDGINVANMGLHDLRTKITILPQDPVLFSGSLRMNLDPFDRHTDDGIWKALECAHLKRFVEAQEGHLNYECGEGGQNLSVGQRQLVCLARTLLHKTRILILDEATAAVDMETDDLIQDTIKDQFTDCTILTIAHRLNTIMDYDRVMVLDQGLIKEFDSPGTLLKDTNGVFYGMAKSAGLV